MIKHDGKLKFIPKSKCDPKFFPKWKLEIDKKKKELIGNMRCYSLHCSGIVIYNDKIPDELKLNHTKTSNQISYNKEDVAESGLSQLFDISNQSIE
jgi:DNA polymerase III alpha subunit